MGAHLEMRYLDIMKKTLSFTLWPEPAIPIEDYIRYLPSTYPAKRLIVSSIVALWKLLKIQKLGLVVNRGYSENQRITGQAWPRLADTMIGLKRLDNLQSCVETVIKEHVEGDFIETGVWRGGACIFMRAVLAAYGITDRRIFVADSFHSILKFFSVDPDPISWQDRVESRF